MLDEILETPPNKHHSRREIGEQFYEKKNAWICIIDKLKRWKSIEMEKIHCCPKTR